MLHYKLKSINKLKEAKVQKVAKKEKQAFIA